MYYNIKKNCSERLFVYEVTLVVVLKFVNQVELLENANLHLTLNRIGTHIEFHFE